MNGQMEFVIVANGFNRLFSWSNPIAVIFATSEEQALEKYQLKGGNYDYYKDKITEILPVKQWAMWGTYVESEGLPICSECIAADGDDPEEVEEIKKDQEGPCWACMEKCRESCEYWECLYLPMGSISSPSATLETYPTTAEVGLFVSNT
jgi:hypothetical protein